MLTFPTMQTAAAWSRGPAASVLGKVAGYRAAVAGAAVPAALRADAANRI
jgi:hypothetical protein